VVDGDVVYAFAESELIRGVSVDDEKENRRSRPKRDVNEILDMLNPARQRHRIPPLFYAPPLRPAGKVEDSEEVFPRSTGMEMASEPCPLFLYEDMIQEGMSPKDFANEEVMKLSPKCESRDTLKGLKIQLRELENESNNIKTENEELRNLVRRTLTQTERERKKLNEMEFNLKRKKLEVSNLTARSEELSTKNTMLLEDRCRLGKNVQNLEVQLDNERKHANVMGMGLALPKEIPKNQEKLEKTIDALQTLINKLRSLQVENYKSRVLCIICYDRNWNTALIPCGHCLCDVCARRVTSCPQCRQNVKQRQRMPSQSPNLRKKIVV